MDICNGSRCNAGLPWSHIVQPSQGASSLCQLFLDASLFRNKSIVSGAGRVFILDSQKVEREKEEWGLNKKKM